MKPRVRLGTKVRVRVTLSLKPRARMLLKMRTRSIIKRRDVPLSEVDGDGEGKRQKRDEETY